MRTNGARIEYFKVYVDASGAAAVITYDRFRFAFDTLGEIKVNAIGDVNAYRVERKIALDVCRRAYLAARDAAVDADWMRRNAAMYAQEEQANG